jgi:pyridinium-3,5-bisthiocarboxylic acid mononucleotide nickel chelatase
MARVAYFDCATGAAGDMILGALVDAGLDVERLRAELRKLPLGGWDLTAREVRKRGFRATSVEVLVDDHEHHGHRSLGDILDILERSSLDPRAKAGAARIFARLADAEGRAHGTAPDAVTFHDVGAVDAIIDVTGAVVGLALLGVERVHASALPLGGGFVDGPHGRIPVPGPGTAELLRGYPVVDPGVDAELVTPTGAAILTTLVVEPGRMPAMVVADIGYGAGTMDLPDRPNLLRCLVGETRETSGGETVVQVETTLDDMSPQLYEPLVDRLLETGALDVVLTPVIMKRSRPGVVVSALCHADAVDRVVRLLFEESPTIGIRWSEWRRARLDREVVACETAYGPVPVKVSRLDGRVVTATPEFADVVRLARERSLPVREVLDQARADARRLIR